MPQDLHAPTTKRINNVRSPCDSLDLLASLVSPGHTPFFSRGKVGKVLAERAARLTTQFIGQRTHQDTLN